MRRKIPYLHILCHSLSKNSHGKLLCDMEQLQRPALHDVAIGLPQKCRTMGWLRRCHAALPRSGFVQFVLCGRPHKTKNGNAYTASVKISQQNKPMPAKFRRSPRASMVVAPYAKGYGCAFPPPPRRKFGYAIETR